MELLNLLGPFDATVESISALEQFIGCAVYVLGRRDAGGDFEPMRVGRTEADITVHLERFRSRYDSFMYAQCDSAEAAFLAECELYHVLQPRDNSVHPLKPSTMPATCPVCAGKSAVAAVNSPMR